MSVQNGPWESLFECRSLLKGSQGHGFKLPRSLLGHFRSFLGSFFHVQNRGRKNEPSEMHLDTQNVPEIIKNHLFYYMKMNRRFFASIVFLIDFGVHFGSKLEHFFVVGAPFSHLNRTLRFNLALWVSFFDLCTDLFVSGAFFD